MTDEYLKLFRLMRAIYEIDPEFYRAVHPYFGLSNPFWNGEHEAPTLPHCTSLGGYPIVYLVVDGTYGQAWDACAECASKSEVGDPVDSYIHYEGQPVYCENCNKDIESAYGDPDEDEGVLTDRSGLDPDEEEVDDDNR